MPGKATWAIASAASDILRITAKQPTRPAAIAIAMETERALTEVIVAVVLDRSPVHLLESLGWEDLPRRTEAGAHRPAQTQHVGRVAIDEAQLVGDEEQRQTALLLQTMDHLVEQLLARVIHAGGRVVGQQHRRGADER